MEPTTLDETALDQAPAPTPKPPTPLAATYQFMKSKDFEVPATYEEFEQKALNDPTYLKDLHGLFKEEKWTAPDNLEAFRAQMLDGISVKKKEAPVLSQEFKQQPDVSSPDLAGQPLPQEVPQGVPPPSGLSATPTDPALAAIPEMTGPPHLTEAPPLDPRAPVVSIPEQPILPGGQKFIDAPIADGFERLPVGRPDPYSFQGGDPSLVGPVNHDARDSYLLAADKGTEREGQRYVDHPLSKVAEGETQPQDQLTATMRNFGNDMLGAIKTVPEVAGAVEGSLSRLAGVPYIAATSPFTKATDWLEQVQKPLAPYYEKSQFRLHNPATWPMAASRAAALAAPMVLSALFPEGKIAKAAQAVIGATFDLQLVGGSFERAKQAGLTPGTAAYDTYSLVDATATMLTFKLGAAGVSAAGQALVQKQLIQSVLESLKNTKGPITNTLLADAFAAAGKTVAPYLSAAAKEGGSMGILFGANEAKTIAGESIANAALGRQAFNTGTLGDKASRIGGAMGQGIIVGGASGAAGAFGAASVKSAAADATAKVEIDRMRAQGQAAVDASPGMQMRRRTPEGAKPVPATVPLADLRGKTVMVREPGGEVRLGQVHNTVGTGDTREYIVRNTEGRLTRHAQGEVFIADNAARPANMTPAPAPAPASAGVYRAKEGDILSYGAGDWAAEHPIEQIMRDKDGRITAVQVEGRTGSRIIDDSTGHGATAIADLNRREAGLPEPKPAAAAKPAAAKPITTAPGQPADRPAEPLTTETGMLQAPPVRSLGELVPDTTPIQLLSGGETVTAFRNAEGDIELAHESGQTSIFDKGDQFNRPADEFGISAIPQPEPAVPAAEPAATTVSEPAAAAAAAAEPTPAPAPLSPVLTVPAVAEPAVAEPAGPVVTAEMTDEQQVAHDAAAEHNDLGRTERGGMDGIKKRREIKALADAAGLTYSVSADNKVTLGGGPEPISPTSMSGTSAPAASAAPAAKPTEPATTPTFARRRPSAADGEFVLARPDGSKPGGTATRYRVDEGTGRFAQQQPDGSWAFVPRGIETAVVQQGTDKYGFHADTPVPGAPKQSYRVPYELTTDVNAEFKALQDAAEATLAAGGDSAPKTTIINAVAKDLRAVTEKAIADLGLDVAIESFEVSQGGFTGDEGPKTNPNITFVFGGNAAEVQQLMEALNQGADQEGGVAFTPATPEALADDNRSVYPAMVFDLPTGTSAEAVAAMMEKLYAVKDAEGNIITTGFTRVGDTVVIGSQWYGGKSFERAIAERIDDIERILHAESIPNFEVSPYEILTYSLGAAAKESLESGRGRPGQPASPAGAAGAGTSQGATLEERFRAHYRSVLEGLAGAEKVTPAAEPPAEPVAKPTAADSTKALSAANKAVLAEMKDLGKQLYKALGKGSNTLGSNGSLLNAEASRLLVELAKRAVKLGGGYTKEVMAAIRDATGLSKEDITDAQLRPFAKAALKDAGEYKAKPKAAPEPAAPEPAAAAAGEPADAEGTKIRQTQVTMEEKTGLSDELLSRLRDTGAANYKTKPIAQTIAEVDALIKAGGIDAAYVTATQSKQTGLPGDVLVVLRQRVLTHYDGLARGMEASGNPDRAALQAMQDRAFHVAEVYEGGLGSGTDAGRTLRAHQTMTEFSPHLMVVRVDHEVSESRADQAKKLAPKARRQTKTVRKEKKTALKSALASPAVQAATDAAVAAAQPAAARPATAAAPAPVIAPDPPKWGSTNKIFTKQTLVDAKAALKKLGLSTFVPPEVVHFLGYHMEAGARKFKDVRERAIRDLGQRVAPMLAEAYEQAKRALIAKGDSGQGFDGPDAVEAALNDELGSALADRVVAAARPKVPGGPLDPVREMLDTLVKKVRETLDKDKPTPTPAREAVAAAVNNVSQYADVFESSKQQVEAKIDALKISDAAKQKMRDDLNAYHAEIIGQPYADQQLAKAIDQAEETVLNNYAGKNRGEKLNALALASDAAVARDRQAVIDHVTAGITDPAHKQLLADIVGEEFDNRIEERRQALRVRGDVADVPNPPKPQAAARKPLTARVADLLATRAKDARVAGRIAPEAIREGLNDMGKRLQQIAADHLSDPTDTGRTLAEAFVQRAGLSGQQAKTFAAVIEAEFESQIAAARQKAIDAEYSRAIRTGQEKPSTDVTDRIRKLYGLSPTDESRVLGLVADRVGLPQLSKADNTRLMTLANAIADAKGTNAKAHAVQEFHLAVSTLKGIGGWQMVKSAMYANMLSGPGTQIKNIVSTGLSLGADLSYATGWAGFRAVQQGIRTGSLFSKGTAQMATAPIRGVLNRAGADGAWQMLVSGVRPPGFEGKFDQGSDIEVMARMDAKPLAGHVRKNYARVMRYGARLLSANDIMWSGGAEPMWAYNMAMEQALAEGRARPTSEIFQAANEKMFDTTRRLSDAYAQAEAELAVPAGQKAGADHGARIRIRVRELMSSTRDEMLRRESQRAAAETSFNGPMEGFIGHLMSKVGQLTEVEMGHGIQPLKGVIPFTRIVANVTNSFLNYTPVGFARAAKGKIGWSGNAFERQYSTMERGIVTAKATTGMLVVAVGLAMLQDDDITGSGPLDPQLNRQWQQRGNRPYTLKGFSYKDTPLYYPLAAVAALKEAKAYEGADFEDDPYWKARGMRMLVAVAQTGFASLSLTSLQDLLNATNDPSKGKNPSDRWLRYAQRTAGAIGTSIVVPASGAVRGVLRTYGQVTGQTKREANNVWGMVGQDVPGVRNNLPMVFDELGNEVPVGSNLPFAPAPHPTDEASTRINAFLGKHKLFIPPVNRFQADMAVLKLRNGELTPIDRTVMRTMTTEQRKAYLLKRLGGEEPMPMEVWQKFYPERGRRIKEKLLLHLPELEVLAKTNPRRLKRRLNNYYRLATAKARRGIDFETGTPEASDGAE